MNRRDFMRGFLVAGGVTMVLASPAVAAPLALAATTRRPRRLPNVQSGDPMSAQFFNDLVDRVNELSV